MINLHYNHIRLAVKFIFAMCPPTHLRKYDLGAILEHVQSKIVQAEIDRAEIDRAEIDRAEINRASCVEATQTEARSPKTPPGQQMSRSAAEELMKRDIMEHQRVESKVRRCLFPHIETTNDPLIGDWLPSVSILTVSTLAANGFHTRSDLLDFVAMYEDGVACDRLARVMNLGTASRIVQLCKRELV